jgi:hypothetical protein
VRGQARNNPLLMGRCMPWRLRGGAGPRPGARGGSHAGPGSIRYAVWWLCTAASVGAACDHLSGAGCCAVSSGRGGGSANYLGARSPDPRWASVFTVEECFGPAGPRSHLFLWGGADYVVRVHPCCLQPSARCGLILQIHGLGGSAAEMEAVTSLARWAGAEDDGVGPAAGSSCNAGGQPRYVVVEAQSRSQPDPAASAALIAAGFSAYHGRPEWVTQDADMHAQLMSATVRLFSLDPARIHVTGYSEVGPSHQPRPTHSHPQHRVATACL